MLTLTDVLEQRNLRASWAEVRTNFRDELLRDPLFHLGYQCDINRHLKRLSQEVVDGRYRVSPSWFIKCGKGHGLYRLHTFLDVKDIVLLQAIARRIMLPILKKAPGRTTYFSRSQRPPSPAKPLPPGYPWLVQWKAFQRHILRFSKTYPFVVITDISGYYDNIQHRFLRDLIAELANASREVVDLLFFILEDLTHRPEYIQNIFAGLPVLEYDAPRLLAHAFLFELDSKLHSMPGIEFTRWMDDINIGVKSYADAKRVLSIITQTLRKYYLMPNPAKTRILRSGELDQMFHFRENTWLSKRENRLKIAGRSGGRKLAQARVQLRRRFASWIRKKPKGHWSKVLKRYYTFFGYVQDPGLIGRTGRDLKEQPEVTDHVLRYYKGLGYRERILRIVEQFLDSPDNLYEDQEIKILEFLAEWTVPNKPILKRRLASRALSRLKMAQGNPATDAARGICVLLIAKYGSHSDQREVQRQYLGGRESNPLVKEYVVALSPCLDPTSKRYEQLLSFAGGESSEQIGRIVHLYRTIGKARKWPSEVKPAMTCSTVQLPPRKVLSMRRVAVLYAAAGNRRLRSETRQIAKRLMSQNQDAVVSAQMRRVISFIR